MIYLYQITKRTHPPAAPVDVFFLRVNFYGVIFGKTWENGNGHSEMEYIKHAFGIDSYLTNIPKTHVMLAFYSLAKSFGA